MHVISGRLKFEWRWGRCELTIRGLHVPNHNDFSSV